MRYLLTITLLSIFLLGCKTEVQSCTNTTVYVQNVTYLPAPACVCGPCPSCSVCQVSTPVIKTEKVLDTSCQDRQSAVIHELADCMVNNTNMAMELNTDCYSQLMNCNNTVSDYLGRITNASDWLNRNR